MGDIDAKVDTYFFTLKQLQNTYIHQVSAFNINNDESVGDT